MSSRAITIVLILFVTFIAIGGFVYYQSTQRSTNTDCKFTTTDWKDCDCATFTQTRRNIITEENEGTGEKCPPETETRTCPESERPDGCVKTDCEFVSGSWSACDKPCGGGVEKRVNSITVQASGGGEKCPSINETRPCNIEPCPDIDCEFEWPTQWSQCSEPCGGGMREKRPIILQEASGKGQACPNILTESCNTSPCEGRLVNLSNPQLGFSFIDSWTMGLDSDCVQGTSNPKCLWSKSPQSDGWHYLRNRNNEFMYVAPANLKVGKTSLSGCTSTYSPGCFVKDASDKRIEMRSGRWEPDFVFNEYDGVSPSYLKFDGGAGRFTTDCPPTDASCKWEFRV